MVRVLLVNETRLVCNVLAATIDDEKDIAVVGSATTIEEALNQLEDNDVDVVLVSTRLPNQGALALLSAISEIAPDTKVLVLGLTENRERVLHYVEAGAVGYVLKDDSVEDLINKIRAAQDGKALVSPKIAAVLMERVTELAQMFAEIELIVSERGDLTPRETEVLELLAQNLTNQQIADQLSIEVGTVKNHVHSILDKLDLHNREQAATYLAFLKTKS